jgi:hypothetical protein
MEQQCLPRHVRVVLRGDDELVHEVKVGPGEDIPRGGSLSRPVSFGDDAEKVSCLR